MEQENNQNNIIQILSKTKKHLIYFAIAVLAIIFAILSYFAMTDNFTDGQKNIFSSKTVEVKPLILTEAEKKFLFTATESGKPLVLTREEKADIFRR